MGTNCDSLVAYLFLFCYERDIILTLSDNKQTCVIKRSNLLRYTRSLTEYLSEEYIPAYNAC